MHFFLGMRVLPVWQILFLFLLVSFETCKLFLFLFIQKLALRIYSYSYLRGKTYSLNTGSLRISVALNIVSTLHIKKRDFFCNRVWILFGGLILNYKLKCVQLVNCEIECAVFSVGEIWTRVCNVFSGLIMNYSVQCFQWVSCEQECKVFSVG